MKSKSEIVLKPCENSLNSISNTSVCRFSINLFTANNSTLILRCCNVPFELRVIQRVTSVLAEEVQQQRGVDLLVLVELQAEQAG